MLGHLLLFTAELQTRRTCLGTELRMTDEGVTEKEGPTEQPWSWLSFKLTLTRP